MMNALGDDHASLTEVGVEVQVAARGPGCVGIDHHKRLCRGVELPPQDIVRVPTEEIMEIRSKETPRIPPKAIGGVSPQEVLGLSQERLGLQC